MENHIIWSIYINDTVCWQIFKGKDDIYAAFAAISSGGAAYITRQELEANLSPVQVEYCLRVMPKYDGPDVPAGADVYDYKKFVKSTFN